MEEGIQIRTHVVALSQDLETRHGATRFRGMRRNRVA